MLHGRHVKIVGKGAPELLRSTQVMEQMLQAMVGRLGMRMLGEPHLYEVDEQLAKMNVEPFEDEGGTTGVVVLSTSHCAVHTWPLRAHFVMDVYSCRDYDPTAVQAVLEEHFGAHSMRVTDLSHSLAPAEELEPAGGDVASRPRVEA
ncbi:MAG: S-adenosylmethionine decarboxylase [Myxococcales bacterium]|nr:S-adenosylmethionine decarboxylase [Myxococcales bacterium]